MRIKIKVVDKIKISMVNCYFCNKKINRKNPYYCLVSNNEKLGGEAITVIKAKEEEIFCSKKCLTAYKNKEKRAINLLIKKIKIMNDLLEVSLEKPLSNFTKHEEKIFNKYNKENSEILKELTKLGYTREIKPKSKNS